MKILPFFILLFTLTSCWPTSLSFKDGSVPPEWKFFSVETLESNAPNAPISYAPILTEDLKDAVQNRTGVKLATDDKTVAQIAISGVVSNYIVTPVAIQGNDNASKNRLSITANFDIFVAETADKEEELLQVTSTNFADFDATQDLGTVQNQLFEEINDRIIQDVLNKLLSNW